MLLIRTKSGSIREVEPRFVTGNYVGFEDVYSKNTVYNYEDVTVLSEAEVNALRKLPREKFFERIGCDHTGYLEYIIERLHSTANTDKL